MAKKKTKPVKVLSGRFRVKRNEEHQDYAISNLNNETMLACWPYCEVKDLFKRVICPKGKTATVKITIEVEKIE